MVKNKSGFALPTVLIASMVMLSILTVSVTSVATVRNNLKVQYYSQLAKVAGEAGAAYAEACLAKSGNVPQWSDASPLKPNTDCAGTPLGTLTCPGSAGCYVLSTSTYRTSFSVGKPTLNAQGKAITIPNKGFVELLRLTTGEVWRTYYQPAAQPVVVPDLCSGAATSALGWSNAVAASTTNQISLSDVAAATTITMADSTIPAGPMYFQRNFNVSSSGTYTVKAQTKSAKDVVEIYMDGNKLTTSTGALASATTTLSLGCHTISARLTNKTFAPSYSQFTAAVVKAGATAPVVTTDTAWRASAGASTSFSSPNYYADPTVWQPVTWYTNTHAKKYTPWAAVSSDTFAAMITPAGNGCTASCPGSSYTYLRDSNDFYLSATTSVKVSTFCDDECSAYIDGVLINRNTGWSSAGKTQTISLAAGYHHFGIALFNHLTSANAAGVAASIVDVSSGLVYARTDTSWQGSTTWTSGTADADVLSYAANYTPNPDNFIDPSTIDFLVVGGGGGGGNNGGGGGGGGGVRYFTGIPFGTGTYTVTIGAGGAKAASNTVNASNGEQTSFHTYVSLGGGGGLTRSGTTTATTGGSGGGGAGAKLSAQVTGGAGTAGQGNRGGNGTPADAGTSATGGGGGGAGNVGFNGASAAAAGDGGAGQIFYLGGIRYGVGAGGGAGVTVNGTIGHGTDGAADGVLPAQSAAPATANTGGGGGGGGTDSKSGGGGNGGSGLVVVSFKTGSITASATGAYSTYTATVNGVGYTFYKFTGNGTFTISTLNPS